LCADARAQTGIQKKQPNLFSLTQLLMKRWMQFELLRLLYQVIYITYVCS
jgi:hypothetical protein